MSLTSNGPTQLSSARIRFALLALALGGFAIGATEFVAMGLLPNLASDLLPDVFASNQEQGTAQAGWLISAYALGVVVGAPTIAASAARWPRKQLLLVLLTAFTVATIASALLPTFGLVLVARFVSALPHGAYFGIASLVAADLMGPGKRARGVAFVLSGLTISNVIGVPAITWLGQVAGWRIAYLAVALINSIGNLGGFVAPTTFGFLEQTTGSIQGGLYGLAGTSVLAAILVFFAKTSPAAVLTSPSVVPTGTAISKPL